MTTATLVPISSFTCNGIFDKPRFSQRSSLAHYFPFSNPTFGYRIDSFLKKCKTPKMKSFVTKDERTLLGKDQEKDGFDIEQVDSMKYVRELKKCIRRQSLTEGKQLHAHIIKKLNETDVFLGTNLVNMYGKCGSLVDARQMFDKMPERNIVSWSVLIAAHIQNGFWEDGLKLMVSMQEAGVMPGRITFYSLFNAYAEMADSAHGKVLHGIAIKTGFVSGVLIATNIVNMYAKCGNLVDARQMFDKMPERSIVSWTALIAEHIQHRYWEDALKLMNSMQDAGFMLDRFTLPCLFRACAELADSAQGMVLHGIAIKNGFVSDLWVGSAIVNMYGKCGLLMDAQRMFDRMPEQNVVSLTAMMRGYVENKYYAEAIKLFVQMQCTCMMADQFAVTSVLKACASLENLQLGKQVHAYGIKTKCDETFWVENNLITMYSKSGNIEYAYKIFDKMPIKYIIAWTAMISGYAKYGYKNEALNLINKMQLSQLTINHSSLTFSCILKACASVGALQRGKEIHAHAVKTGFESHLVVGNSLIDMYSKCWNTKDACKIFNGMPVHDIVSWNAMIRGCIRNGHCEKVLELFRQMQIEGMKPDESIFVSVIVACIALQAFELGKQVHVCIIKEGYELYGPVENAVVIMYAKLSFMHNSYNSFDKMWEQNVVS